MHVTRIFTAIIAGLILTATACSILPDSGKSTYAIAQEATECQLEHDPNKGLGMGFIGGKNAYAQTLEQTMTRDQVITLRDKECSKIQTGQPTTTPYQLPWNATPYRIGPTKSYNQPQTLMRNTPQAKLPRQEGTPLPTVHLATSTPVPPAPPSTTLTYNPTQTKRERQSPVDCKKEPDGFQELKITPLNPKAEISDAKGNTFIMTAIRTWTRACRDGTGADLVLKPRYKNQKPVGDWTGYQAEWRTLQGITVGYANPPQFTIELTREREPEDLKTQPLELILYDTTITELVPTQMPINTPTHDETETKFRYDPAQAVRPRGQTGEYPKTLDIKEQNTIISDAVGNRWKITNVHINNHCLKTQRYNRDNCLQHGLLHTIELVNTTRSKPDFVEYQARWKAEDGTSGLFSWQPGECLSGYRWSRGCGQQGKAYFYYKQPDTTQRIWRVEIYDNYRRTP